MKRMTAMSARDQMVARLIAEALKLEDVKPEEIDPQAPLMREGPGRYSNDAFEQPLAVSGKCGCLPQPDDQQNSASFGSLRAGQSRILYSECSVALLNLKTALAADERRLMQMHHAMDAPRPFTLLVGRRIQVAH